ncbi:voltage-dependent anion-selective channel protein 2-like [Halichondria panicea]|uniref:voltage-dependent anion-selective channel protein 2-like n=1 Tax=Halichondria panicea TaxID=6063 RepID=UPI00312BADD0
MSQIPPSFGDLGKSARDLFDKEYEFGKVKLGLKTKTESGVEFETNGSHDLEKNRTSGNLKTKIKFPDYGVTFSESWNTNSELNTELAYEPCSIDGLKLTLNSSFLPSSGNKSAQFKTNYKRDYVNVDTDVDLQMTGPIFRGATVFQYNGWYGGYQVGYNTSNAKLTANNVAVGYQGADFTVNTKLADIADCQTSVFHKASDKTEVGLSTRYNLQTSNVSLGLATKYTLNDGAILKAKVNNQGQIGMAYTQSLRTGVKLNLSCLVEGRNINAGGHKLGMAIDFES